MKFYTKILLVSLITIFLFTPMANSSVLHTVDINNDEAEVSSILTLESKSETNVWNITIGMPEGTHMQSMEDTRGDIDYKLKDGDLNFETNSGPGRNEETVMLNYTVSNITTNEHRSLDSKGFSLFGFKEEETKVSVEVPDLVSFSTPFGFRSQKRKGNVKFEGEGPMFLRLYTSENGKESENYLYFSNEEKIEKAEEFFPILPYITGISSPHEKYPIVFMNDTEYESLVNEWSNGRYRNGGLIFVRENITRPGVVPVILHETTHGFVEKLTKWDYTETSYIDEGMAKFVEFLVVQKMDEPQPEIFGDRTTFDRDGGRFYYKSRSSSEQLWNYYDDGNRWMETWSPWKEVDNEVRSFGYAYSELMIRNHVKDNGLTSLRNVSKKFLEVDEKMMDPKDKAEIVEGILGTMRPCYNYRKDEFTECLNEVNQQKFELNNLDINITTQEDERDINVSTDFKEELEEKQKEIEEKNQRSLVQKILERFRNILTNILEAIF